MSNIGYSIAGRIQMLFSRSFSRSKERKNLMKRVRTILCCTLVLVTISIGTALAGQVEPAPLPPPPDTHIKISKPVASGTTPARDGAPHRLAWFEMVEMMLSSLGLI